MMSNRIIVVAISLVCITMPAGALAEEPTEENADQAEVSRMHYWESLTDPRGYLSATYLSQDTEDPLRGFRLSSGLINEFPYRRGLVRRNEMDSWLSQRRKDDQTIWSLGLGFDLFYALAWGPARLLPRGTFGLEYRTEDPDNGLGAFIGAGASLDVWLSRSVAISLSIERQFCYPGSDNNQLGVSFRFVSEKLPPLIPTV